MHKFLQQEDIQSHKFIQKEDRQSHKLEQQEDKQSNKHLQQGDKQPLKQLEKQDKDLLINSLYTKNAQKSKKRLDNTFRVPKTIQTIKRELFFL